MDNTIFGAINFPGTLVDANPSGNSQLPLFSSQGALTCTTAFCVAFSQVNPAGPIAVNLTDTLIATTTFTVEWDNVADGSVVHFTWRTTPSTQRLDWFGISNAPGVSDNTIFGALNFNDAQVNSNAAGNSQTPLFSSQGAFTCTTAFCVAFSQVNAAGPIAVNLTDTLIATTTFIVDPAVPVGTVITFVWRTSPSTQRLDWFGITNAPGYSLTIAAIPEPTTAALLGVGLLGIALAARRRT